MEQKLEFLAYGSSLFCKFAGWDRTPATAVNLTLNRLNQVWVLNRKAKWDENEIRWNEIVVKTSNTTLNVIIKLSVIVINWLQLNTFTLDHFMHHFLPWLTIMEMKAIMDVQAILKVKAIMEVKARVKIWKKEKTEVNVKVNVTAKIKWKLNSNYKLKSIWILTI